MYEVAMMSMIFCVTPSQLSNQPIDSHKNCHERYGIVYHQTS